jgi:hypothetical protein
VPSWKSFGSWELETSPQPSLEKRG